MPALSESADEPMCKTDVRSGEGVSCCHCAIDEGVHVVRSQL